MLLSTTIFIMVTGAQVALWTITHPLDVRLSACVVIGVVWAAGYRRL